MECWFCESQKISRCGECLKDICPSHLNRNDGIPKCPNCRTEKLTIKVRVFEKDFYCCDGEIRDESGKIFFSVPQKRKIPDNHDTYLVLIIVAMEHLKKGYEAGRACSTPLVK